MLPFFCGVIVVSVFLLLFLYLSVGYNQDENHGQKGQCGPHVPRSAARVEVGAKRLDGGL